MTGAARYHSDGAFTVNLDRALEQLGRLPSYELFVLKLVQAAIGARASWVKVSTRQGPVVVEHDGREVDALELTGDLAIGVYGALAGPVSQVSLDSGPTRCTFSRSGSWRSPLRPPMEHQRVVAELTVRSAFGGRGPGAAVREDCRYSPVPIWLNGEQVSGLPLCPPAAPSGLAARWLRSGDYLEGAVHRDHHLIERYWIAGCNRIEAPKVSAASLSPRVPAALLRDERPTVACTAVLAVRPTTEPLGVLELVRSGVVVAREKIELGCAGGRVALAIDDLDTDLLGFSPVRNAAWEARISELRTQVATMRLELLHGLDCLGLPRNLRSSLLARI